MGTIRPTLSINKVKDTGTHPPYFLLLRWGSLYIIQASLKLLSLNNPPASGFQVPGTTIRPSVAQKRSRCLCWPCTTHTDNCTEEVGLVKDTLLLRKGSMENQQRMLCYSGNGLWLKQVPGRLRREKEEVSGQDGNLSVSTPTVEWNEGLQQLWQKWRCLPKRWVRKREWGREITYTEVTPRASRDGGMCEGTGIVNFIY